MAELAIRHLVLLTLETNVAAGSKVIAFNSLLFKGTKADKKRTTSHSIVRSNSDTL